MRAPAVAPGRGRLVARRAADERDDGRRGHAPAGVPRHPRRRRRPSARPPGSAPSSATTAPGRTSTAGPGSSRRRSRPTGRCAWRATGPSEPHMRAAAAFVRAAGRARAGARVHAPVAGAVRAVVLGAGARRCRRSSILLPSWVPLNVYDFACWARQTIVALQPRQNAPAGARAAASAWTSSIAARGALRRAARPAPSARACCGASTARSAPTSAGRCARCGGSRWRGPSAGSCAARRPTAPGAGSSRRGSTR